MALREHIENDLMSARKKNEKEKIEALRVIVGEFERQDKKELSDNEILLILKKFKENETELLNAKNETTSIFLELVISYLPQKKTKEEIIQWISENVDFTKLKNKMQAISIVTKQFGTAVDGKEVKDIIQNWK